MFKLTGYNICGCKGLFTPVWGTFFQLTSLFLNKRTYHSKVQREAKLDVMYKKNKKPLTDEPTVSALKKYKDVESVVKIEEVDGAELVKTFAEEMEEMLGRKMKSVKNNYTFDYYNSLVINKVDEDGNALPLGGEFPLEENEHFNKLPVNTQLSNIQVPTNVYNRDPDILNGVYMSEALNEVFIDNFQKDPTLTWQYFGSSTGFFRLYPGIQWIPDDNGVVTFDSRNRNWYIQAATSPKDVVIVVDVSGSMKGLRLTIAKHTINTILDTLGENDFVNIIAYSDYVRYVEPCFKGMLVQADLDNREHFKLLVDELHVKGEGKVKKAMKESFKILNEAAALGQGSLCNQAIMLITDGAMEDFQDVFKDFNWPDRRVRVFTYLIGREMTFADNVKWIACNNKGYYTHVSTLADVQENVMEYLHVLSRPMVINHDHDIIWTEAYMDSVLFNTQAQSLLLMTSVAMPVFSKKKETLSHGILLGVVGTDVALRELMRLAPRYKYKEGKKLKPKPNYNSVDLSEVEWEDTEEKLRTAMVKGETGGMSLDVRTSVDKGTRVMFLKNDYSYTVINETPFSLGIVLTRGYGQYIFIGNVSVEEGLHDLLAPDLTIANEWTYCETDIDPAHRKLSQLQAVVGYLTGKEPDLDCDALLLQQTLFDAVVTAPMEAYWTALMLNTSGMDDRVETVFLGTRSGLMRFQRYTGIEKRIAKSFLTSTDKENMFTLDHFPVWYRRAAEYPAGQFLYYMPRQETRGRGHTFTEQTSTHTGTQNTICTVLFPIFSAVFSRFSQKSLSDRLISLQPDIACYVIDNNGFVLISKQRNDVSSHTLTHTDTEKMCFLDFIVFDLIVSELLLLLISATSAHKKKGDILQPCDTEYPSFVYEPSVKETNSIIKCGRCQKMFVVQQIPESNLLLLVVQADCDCSRQFPPINMEPKELSLLDRTAHNASVKCDRMRSQKIRRRPESCHAYHPQVSFSLLELKRLLE
uniref:Calcium voltage-gated channel auxiliary subunit alpha2delta 4 n=1 Tax=Sparus aurata TaxID=8175 RepID=A0A671W5D9_SPAAU